ncbi:MAG: phage tail sheath C-terminal domain-containing protein, partial [Candidimonas sp.]
MVLVSPGVEVSVTDESFYAGAGQGTIPLIFIATHQDKVAPSGVGVAPGTLATTANSLQLMTSQRELIQTYGDPVFYSINGTPQHGNELNEYGLHAAYQYMGLSDRAYVVRADVDLGQLQPSSVPPRGLPVNGTYWLDLNETSWGVFESNGNSNPGFAFDNQNVNVIDVKAKSQTCYIGNRSSYINSHTLDSVITTNGNLVINGISVALTAGDTFSTILVKIGSANISNIEASLYAHADIVDDTGNVSTPDFVPGVRYDIRIVNTVSGNINFNGSDASILIDLGLNTSVQEEIPSLTIGEEGDYAVITFNSDNKIFQKLTPRTASNVSVNTPDVGPHWYHVGSDEWKSATPTVITSTVITSSFVAGSFDILHPAGPTTITVNNGDTIADISNTINATANSNLRTDGIVAYATGTQLIFANIFGENIEFDNDVGGVLAALGFEEKVYKGNQLYYRSHTQVPTDSVSGDVWIKTTQPNRGAFWATKRYNSGVSQWISQTSFFFVDDTTATSTLGGSLSVGNTYIRYDVNGNGTATHQIRRWDGSSWSPLVHEASFVEPSSDPSAGALWFNNDFRVDIMVSDGSTWMGYRNRYPGTDIILSASEPLAKPNGSSLVDYDIWIDTSDLENYPLIRRWFVALNEWQLIDNTDQTTPFGIVFADARQDAGSAFNNSEEYDDMMESNFIDIDAPDPLLYPDGLLLFNTRYGTLNVKEWTPGYVFEGVLVGDRWVTVSGNKVDGSPYMGRGAQRIMIVRALAESIVSNEDIRSEIVFFNLLAAPGYPEVIDELSALNVDKKQWAFIAGDTPPRLRPNSTELTNWATGVNAVSNGEDGLVTADPYVGVYYPWGLSTNIDGTEVMVPPSTMALRTLAYNDSVAYPWLAPAGFTRGLVTNATTVGYLTNEEEFRPVILNQGQRDVLYLNNVNPISYMPNRGLVVFGQKTRLGLNSALDRINVARLANYLKYQLEQLGKPFLFEPNDQQTRDAVVSSFSRFLGELIGLRALDDFAVQCDL